jgi:fumarate reductase subunit C
MQHPRPTSYSLAPVNKLTYSHVSISGESRSRSEAVPTSYKYFIIIIIIIIIINIITVIPLLYYTAKHFLYIPQVLVV